MNLKGKSALITGGSRGIGASIALKFAGLGANVAVTYRDSAQAADAVVARLRDFGVMALGLAADVADHARAQLVVNHVCDAFAGLDILVNNAGMVADRMSWKMSETDWDDVIDVNLKGCFNYSRAVADGFRQQRQGKIVNIASINGLRGKVGQANYAAAKGGMIALTKTMARELGPKNINVNAIAPGLIETDLTAGMAAEARHESIRQIPLGRIGLPADVANAAAFLASDLARHITGQILNVDGGQLI